MQESQVNDNDPWDAEPDDIIPTTIKLPEPINKVGPWQTKIKFDFEACRKWGIKEKYISWLQHGVDISMHSLPDNARFVDNYSSLMDYEDVEKIEAQLWQMVKDG